MSLKITTVFTCFAASMALASNAGAAILVSQLPDTSSQGVANQEFPDLPEFSTYIVDDATFGMDVNVTAFTLFMTGTFGSWPTTASAVLNIFDGDPLLTSDDPTAGGDYGLASVDVTITETGGIFEVLAADLDIDLAAGTYWFGLTPIISSNSGQEFTIQAETPTGLDAQGRNPADGFGRGTDWFTASALGNDSTSLAFIIEGDASTSPIPLPAGLPMALAAFGALGLISRRRRS